MNGITIIFHKITLGLLIWLLIFFRLSILVSGLDLWLVLLGILSRALLRTHVKIVMSSGRNDTPYLYNENKKIIYFIQSETK